MSNNTNYIDKLNIGGIDRPIQDADAQEGIATLSQALSTKQDAINDLQEIRSGAAAGATAYQKPTTGILLTDLAQAVQNAISAAGTALQPSDITTLSNDVATLKGLIAADDPVGAIDKFNEIVAFLNGMTSTDSMQAIVASIAAKYTKPSTGIPSSDMSQAVQNSLALADSAYQKPSTGIPSSDIAPGVIPSELPANGGNAATVNNHSVNSDVPANAVFTDTDTTYKQNLNGTDVGGGSTSLGIFYAPTTAGTNGQYLKSSGNGAPVWENFPSSLPASDVQAWAKAANKPSYDYDEIGYNVNNVGSTQTPNTATTISLAGTTPLHVVITSVSITAVTLSANPAAGHSCHVIFFNSGSSELTVEMTHDATNRVCPDGADPDPLTIPAGGYVEIDFLSVGGKVYVRGV